VISILLCNQFIMEGIYAYADQIKVYKAILDAT
jgi:hypothetical protein